MQVSTIGLDIAKNVFQVHGIDDAGRAVLCRKVRRDRLVKLFEGLDPCLVGLEACATAPHWARQLMALGHQVKLMPPAYVKAYVKRNKNDAADAEAICEAVRRPMMPRRGLPCALSCGPYFCCRAQSANYIQAHLKAESVRVGERVRERSAGQFANLVVDDI